MSSPALLAGFADACAGSQRCFRATMGALAEPGIAQVLPAPQESPPQCSAGTASLGLALLDGSTPFHVIGLPGLAGYLRFHTGAPEATAAQAHWVFASANHKHLLALVQGLSSGSLDYPETAATLVLELAQHPDSEPPSLWLQGPGIAGTRHLPSLGLAQEFWRWRQAQRTRYPLGIDLLFVFGTEVWALPRSTEILLEDACTLP